MTDVARRAGVSRALVSIVFRDAPGASAATRKRVRDAAAELGYRPDARARLLGRGRSRTLGVVYGIGHEFHGELVERLYAASTDSGYDLALGAAAPSRRERTAVRSLLEFRCEGLILVGTSLSHAEIKELSSLVPVVVMARHVRGAGVDVVSTDDVAGARLAVEHLVALGHREIVHVDGGRAPGAADRRRGYRQAMSTDGLGDQCRFVLGGLTDADGESAAAELLGRRRPSAVTAFNDHCAAGLMAAGRAQQLRIPEDLSVVGYDDSSVARLSTVDLTTVAQDAAELAGAAVSRIRARLEEDAAPGVTLIPPSLVVRSSTGPPGTLGDLA
jgi:DNA-binding LacI/PurR family transcriptional regulator